MYERFHVVITANKILLKINVAYSWNTTVVNNYALLAMYYFRCSAIIRQLNGFAWEADRRLYFVVRRLQQKKTNGQPVVD